MLLLKSLGHLDFVLLPFMFCILVGNVTVQASQLYGRLYLPHRENEWRMSFLPCDSSWVYWCPCGCSLPDKSGLARLRFLSILMSMLVLLTEMNYTSFPFPYFLLYCYGLIILRAVLSHVTKIMCYKIYLTTFCFL